MEHPHFYFLFIISFNRIRTKYDDFDRILICFLAFTMLMEVAHFPTRNSPMEYSVDHKLPNLPPVV